MMPHANFHKRIRNGKLVDWRFTPTRGKLQKQLNREKAKPEEEQDKGAIERLIRKLKEMMS